MQQLNFLDKMNTNNEIGYFNELLTSLKEELDNKLKDIDTIEEKYRKLKEEELGDLMSQKEKLDKKINGLKALIACYEDNGETSEKSNEEAQPEKLTITPKKKVETHKSPEPQQPKEKEKEPEITDTLFPENNNTEAESESKPESVDVEAEVVNTQESDDFTFGDEDEKKDDDDDNDDWANQPIDWN